MRTKTKTEPDFDTLWIPLAVSSRPISYPLSIACPHNLNNDNKQATEHNPPPQERLMAARPSKSCPIPPSYHVLLLYLRPPYSFTLSAVTNPMQNVLYILPSVRYCFSSHRMMSPGGRGTSNIV